MKKEITLNAVPTVLTEAYRTILDAFEAQSDIHVNLEIIEWEMYRARFVNIALQHRYGDVAVAGTPATSDLIGMNALRPFSFMEIATMGGQSTFLGSRWQSGIRPGDQQVWAIPWLLDIRVLYYWKDMLAQAGVDETKAFQTPQGFQAALQCLKDRGLQYCWSGPSERYAILHTVSSWIWASGGDLFSSDRRRACFHEEAALTGMRAYFDALRYSRDSLGPIFDNQLFMDRKVPIMLGNGWGLNAAPSPELGCAPVFGSSYLGGSDLMVWAHSRDERAAMELLRFLTRSEIQLRVALAANHLPSRLSALSDLAADANPVRQTLVQAAKTGRTYPCVPMIGLVEDRLSQSLQQIQQEVLTGVDVDVDKLLRQRITSLGNRTNMSLGV